MQAFQLLVVLVIVTLVFSVVAIELVQETVISEELKEVNSSADILYPVSVRGTLTRR